MLRRIQFRTSLTLLLVSVCLLAFGPALAAQSDKPPAAPEKRNGTSHIRIEVTGGDENKPVAEASVYLRFPKDKKTELDLKTNQEGIARSPGIPQIVAPGWKTYGEYHDVTETEQTIQIHLVKPTTRWY